MGGARNRQKFRQTLDDGKNDGLVKWHGAPDDEFKLEAGLAASSDVQNWNSRARCLLRLEISG
jgi:hypothetical protein